MAEQRMVIEESRRRILTLAIVFGALGWVSLLASANPGADRVGVILMRLLGAFFAGMSTYWLFLLARGLRPILVLSASGAEFSQAGLGLVRWDEIASVETVYIPRSGKGLTFTFRDPQSIRDRLSGWGRMRSRWAASLGFGEIIVPFGMVATPIDDALEYIRLRCGAC